MCEDDRGAIITKSIVECKAVNNAIQWQVESINEKENSLLIQVNIQPDLLRHRKAMENMQSILYDYDYYLNGSPNSDIEQIQ